MNILLVYPKYPDTFWSFKHALKFISKKALFPPLGLLTVAALLPEEWEQKLIDLNIAPLRDQDLAWADYVFLSALVVQKDSVKEIIVRCQHAGVKIVAGGPLFTAEYENFNGVDHFVLNEAEITLPAFVADIKQGHAQHLYTTHAFPEITSTPIPRWELLEMKHYASMNIQYSRGCPFSGIITAMVGLLNAPRGTRLYKRIVKENRLVKDSSGDNTDFSTNFIPTMGYDTLVKGYKRIISGIYAPQPYYERVKQYLQDHQPLEKPAFHFHLGHIRFHSGYVGALFKSIILLGIQDKERRYFWKFFFWSLCRSSPRLFASAMTYAIYGYHFRKVFENYL